MNHWMLLYNQLQLHQQAKPTHSSTLQMALSSSETGSIAFLGNGLNFSETLHINFDKFLEIHGCSSNLTCSAPYLIAGSSLDAQLQFIMEVGKELGAKHHYPTQLLLDLCASSNVMLALILPVAQLLQHFMLESLRLCIKEHFIGLFALDKSFNVI